MPVNLYPAPFASLTQGPIIVNPPPLNAFSMTLPANAYMHAQSMSGPVPVGGMSMNPAMMPDGRPVGSILSNGVANPYIQHNSLSTAGGRGAYNTSYPNANFIPTHCPSMLPISPSMGYRGGRNSLPPLQMLSPGDGRGAHPSMSSSGPHRGHNMHNQPVMESYIGHPQQYGRQHRGDSPCGECERASKEDRKRKESMVRVTKLETESRSTDDSPYYRDRTPTRERVDSGEHHHRFDRQHKVSSRHIVTSLDSPPPLSRRLSNARSPLGRPAETTMRLRSQTPTSRERERQPERLASLRPPSEESAYGVSPRSRLHSHPPVEKVEQLSLSGLRVDYSHEDELRGRARDANKRTERSSSQRQSRPVNLTLDTDVPSQLFLGSSRYPTFRPSNHQQGASPAQLTVPPHEAHIDQPPATSGQGHTLESHGTPGEIWPLAEREVSPTRQHRTIYPGHQPAPRSNKMKVWPPSRKIGED